MYRYLEIMNFGDGDKRTSTLSALYEKPEDELGHIISDYKVILKLSEKEYEEIHKLLEYKGEYSYNELRAKVYNLSEKIDKAISYIYVLKNNVKDFKTEYKEDMLNMLDDIGNILGDKENEEE